MRINNTILGTLRRTVAVFLLATITVSAFAVLGDGKGKAPKKSNSLMSRQSYTPGTFSLKSGYSYRGNQVINQEQPKVQSINLNTVLTYQKGNTTYVVPLKKKVYVTTTNAGITLNH